MPHRDSETPFEDPPLMEGYPLDQQERDALEKALRDLDSATPAQRSPKADERPAAASA